MTNKVTIFGTGYVGLVTGTCLAEIGNHVVCVDVNQAKIDGLNNGIIPIYEPGLEPMVKANHAARRLFFSTDAIASIEHGDLLFIAVGTPADEDGSADLRYVLDVARLIGRHLSKHTTIVNKSTVPVGTADKVRAVVSEELALRGIDIPFDVVSNPEFLKEGDAISDCMRPDRIVVGAESPRAIERMKRLYAPLNRNHERIVLMDTRSAELTKYAANAMLATKISFMNEMANIAEQVGADIENVRLGIGSDPRIGWHFIYPGAGYGGSCFPKDVQALQHIAQTNGVQADLLSAVERVNASQKMKLLELIDQHFGNGLEGLTVALWGLAFKPNTDDMREASSRVLMEQLWERGARVRAYDPEANDEARRIYGERADLHLCSSANEALDGADALVVITEWKEFRSPDLATLADAISGKVIFDGRNIYSPTHIESAGIAYYGIGRGRSCRGSR